MILVRIQEVNIVKTICELVKCVYNALYLEGAAMNDEIALEMLKHMERISINLENINVRLQGIHNCMKK